MEFPATLEQQLNHLTHDLKQSGDDPGAVFKALVDDLTTAIPSFLGLTVSWPTLAGPVTLTTMDRAGVDAAGTSLLLPLDLLSDTATNGSSVTFFAKNPGAFVDLASDTQFAYPAQRGTAASLTLVGNRCQQYSGRDGWLRSALPAADGAPAGQRATARASRSRVLTGQGDDRM